MKLLSALLVIVLSFYTNFAIAGSDLSVGSTHKGFININYISEKRKIPLPEGTWEVYASELNRNNVNTPLRNLLLLKIEKKVVAVAIKLTFTELLQNNGYVRSRMCDREDVHYEKVYANYDGGEQDCELVLNYRYTFQGSKNDWENAVGDLLIKKGFSWPHHAVASYNRFADRNGFIDLGYLFSPSAFGFERFARTHWAGSPWHPDSTAEFPERLKFVNAVIEWTKASHSILKGAFKNKLVNNNKLPKFLYRDITKTPVSTGELKPKTELNKGGVETGDSAKSRLSKIKSLLERGLITKDEATKRRKLIIDNL
jgi:hypothetical protein